MNILLYKFKLWFDRLLSKSLLRQFAILGVALVVIFLLSWFFLHLSGCVWKDFCTSGDISVISNEIDSGDIMLSVEEGSVGYSY